jgi:pyruvate dehydrogenase E2 component (dihydrolipoamide acetyltransferase)
MAKEFKLPDLGEGIHEGEIVAVLVAVGQDVKEGEPIMEVETDKATVEIPSPYTGKVSQIHVKAGDEVQVGDVMMSFDGKPEEAAPREEAKAPEEKKKEEKAAAAEAKKPEEAKKAAAEAKPAKREEKPAAREAAPPKKEGVVPASPAARRRARELGVDLHEVPPSGRGGRVTMQDIREFAEKKEAPPEKAEEKPARAPAGPPAMAPPSPELPDFERWGPVERIEVKGVRRATARQMALAWQQIPHVTHQDEADVTDLEELRKDKKRDVEDQGGKLSATVFLLKASVAALKAFPRFNSSLDAENEEIVVKQYYHIGVAMDTERGLVVPVIRDVDRKSMVELSVELKELVARARDGKLSPEDFQGGTFTITNPGMLGGTSFTPIINYPQVAILGAGQSKMRPVVQEIGNGEDYEIEPRLMMPVILSFDHRVCDGAEAARFVTYIVQILEDPGRMLLSI